jgi:uncharacterized protein (DUF1800 family)
MLEFLDGSQNVAWAPNENYARELQELYALGADRGAYTEDDVREMARALTGFRADWSQQLGSHNHRYDPGRHDNTTKTLYKGTAWERSGRLRWEQAVHAVVDHPMHPSFVVLKLWAYFIPTAPSAQTQAELEQLYRKNGERLLPIIEAILLHPDLHAGPSMTKSPVVHAASLLRATSTPIMSSTWYYLAESSGQFLGFPPNVAGWNERAWLNTSSHAARWQFPHQVLRETGAKEAQYVDKTESPTEAIENAIAYWGNPLVSDDVMRGLRAVAQTPWAPRTPNDPYSWSMAKFFAHRQNALRQLIAAAPDFQVC